MKNCPKCLGGVENYKYVCHSPGCKGAGIPAQSNEEGATTGSSPACEQCGEVMSLRVCPDCGFEMEAGELLRELLPVTIIGSSGCGKSNFIAVMIDQLRSQMCKVYGCTLYPTGGDRTMDYYAREYRRPLYEQGVCVPTTEQEDINPLTYTLLFADEKGKGGSKSVGLAFYDSCGKKLENQHDMSAHNRSLYSSGGILFLLDPSQLPLIKEARKAGKMPIVASDTQELLLRMVHLIRTGLSVPDGKKIDIPIAVCLTKLDTLSPHLDPASLVGDSTRHLSRPMLNAADLSGCNLEVQSLFESWGGGEIVRHVRSQFANYSFFGISSLGGQPGSQNEVVRVNPHRVLDPLLWLLWKKQILKVG